MSTIYKDFAHNNLLVLLHWPTFQLLDIHALLLFGASVSTFSSVICVCVCQYISMYIQMKVGMLFIYN